MRVLIGGVGYTNLHDMSVGPALVDRLRALSLPENVEVDDLNHLVATYQRLSQERYDKLIFVGAMKRGREPGVIDIYGYGDERVLPDEQEIRERVAEGVGGTIDLDSVLIVCKYYGVLPPEVFVVDIEPEDDTWGEGFTPKVAEAFEKIIDIVLDEARQIAAWDVKANA